MGVKGLWQLIEEAGKPVPVESLENRILAVDVSIWLHQLVKGFRETSSSKVNNAHLLGLFRRICKLLYFRIKPVFVFDGGVPALKKKTIAARQSGRNRAAKAGEKARLQLLHNLVKQAALTAGSTAGGGYTLPPALVTAAVPSSSQDSMFQLPPLPNAESKHCNSSGDSSDDEVSPDGGRFGDLHSIDVTSPDFLALPPDMRHAILTELKETRKQNSWGMIHKMPENLGDFSSFQMGRLLKRRSVQVGLEHAESEMGGKSFTISDIKTILAEDGIMEEDISQRIAGDDTTRFMYASKKSDAVKASTFKSGKRSLSPVEESDEDLISVSTDSVGHNSSSELLMVDSDVGELSQAEILKIIQEQNKGCKDDASTSGDQKKRKLLAENTKYLISCSQNEDTVKIDVDSTSTWKSAKEEEGDVELLSKEKGGISPGNLNKVLESSLLKAQDKPLQEIFAKNHSPVHQHENFTRNVLQQPAGGDVNLGTSSVELPEKVDEVQLSPTENVATDMIEDSKVKFLSKQISAEMNSSKDDNSVEGSEVNLSDVSLLGKILEEAKTPQHLSSSEAPANISPSKREPPMKLSRLVNDVVIPVEDTKIRRNFQEDVGESLSKNDLSVSKSDEEMQNNSDSDCKSVSSNKVDGSSSDDDDFLEVPSDVGPSLEIVIDPLTKGLEDDIFADVFSPLVGGGNTKAETITDGKTSTLDESVSEVGECKLLEAEVITDSSTYFKKEDLKIVADKPKPLSAEEIEDIRERLQKESAQLIADTKREERLATSISDQLTTEAQELLQLFGIPFIVAPMEAEAQCSFLESSGQTEGTISDDSDVWLFGANTVYKNFFNQKKYVMRFKAFDIQRCFKLKREDMVLFALLVGSDYTVGLEGVGPVTALEILAHYPVQSQDQSPQERLVRFKRQYTAGALKPTIAKKLKSMRMTHGFPSGEVVRAYLEPEVNEERDPFSWCRPDLCGLRQYARDKFGWDQQQTDHTLVPILDRVRQSSTQMTLHGYFDWSIESFPAKKSKRIVSAVKMLTERNQESEEVLHPAELASRVLPEDTEKQRLQTEKSGNSCASSLAVSPSKAFQPRRTRAAVDEQLDASDALLGGAKKRKQPIKSIASTSVGIPVKNSIKVTRQEAKERAARILAMTRQETQKDNAINKKGGVKKR